MKQAWEKWSAKFNSFSLRERGIIFFTAVLVMTVLFHSLFLEPLITKEQASSRQLVQMEQEIQTLQAEMLVLQNALSGDPNAAMKSRLVDVKERLQEINDLLQDKQRQLISPDEITRVLEAILIQNRKLKLITLSNLPMEPLIGMDKPVEQADSSVLIKTETTEQIYKHGVEITVQGGYFDLLTYLDELEKIPSRMFWEHVSLRVDDHPSAMLTLKVFTLSLDKTWLKV